MTEQETYTIYVQIKRRLRKMEKEMNELAKLANSLVFVKIKLDN